MKKILFLLLPAFFISFAWPQTSAGAQNEAGSVSGFDGIQWGTSYEDVKEKLRNLSASPDAAEPATIISDNPDREIRLMRKNVIYRYVFYTRPKAVIMGQKGEQPDPNDAPAGSGNIPRLFLVESTFSYVPAENLESNLAEKYGKRNGGKVDPNSNRGFYLWELGRGYIIEWVDPYKKKPFSRSIYYASKDILAEIKSDFKKYQYTREIKTLLDILY